MITKKRYRELDFHAARAISEENFTYNELCYFLSQVKYYSQVDFDYKVSKYIWDEVNDNRCGSCNLYFDSKIIDVITNSDDDDLIEKIKIAVAKAAKKFGLCLDMKSIQIIKDEFPDDDNYISEDEKFEPTFIIEFKFY